MARFNSILRLKNRRKLEIIKKYRFVMLIRYFHLLAIHNAEQQEQDGTYDAELKELKNVIQILFSLKVH